MALDPRVRDELERRGPTNVRELLRIRTGPGDHDSVALQLAGVPDPPRSEVEDWLREAEREGETVTRDTLGEDRRTRLFRTWSILRTWSRTFENLAVLL
jgi:hypothetical protein